MSRKIKLHSLHFLFQIFSFLADKSGGWKLFVKPKLIIGSLILGLGFTACNTKSNNSGNQNTKPTEIIDSFDSQTGKNKKDADNQKKDTIPDSLKISVSSYLVGNDDEFDSNNNDPNKIYDIVEHMPQFPGGDEALFKYLSSEIRYPKLARNKGIQGRVIVRFVVDKKGNIGQIAVVRSVEPSLDKEAVRIISSMPKWIPGKQNGVNVNVWFTLPINFKLQ